MTGSQLKRHVIGNMRATSVHPTIVERVRKEIRFPKTLRILGESLKVEKGEKQGVLTAVVYLSPSTESKPYGGQDVCPFASAGCATRCLGHSSGRLAMSGSRNARLWKTLAYKYARAWFLLRLKQEIRAHASRAERKGMIPAVRLNGSSDLPHLSRRFAIELPDVQFYDYTKSFVCAIMSKPDNLHVTFSLSEKQGAQAEALMTLRAGGTVAIVFRTKDSDAFPSTWNGFPVINGDESDVRFRDPAGCVVGLTAKGKAMQDTTGFVQEI